MITSEKKYSYVGLFEAANEVLGLKGQEGEITSLNDYFYHIDTLADIDLKYTVLPLDEEPFFIDANTRKIEIPKEFEHGVGVQGDQTAETIYFKIDRYFDFTDLNTQNIYIQWENAAGDRGLSKEYVRDVTTYPNYIVFGWPLTSEITAFPGKVKFSVRFYTVKEQSNGDKLVNYSFATQPQYITINETMNFSLVDNSIQRLDNEVKDMILDRLQNSLKDQNPGQIEPPVFIKNLVSGENYDITSDDNIDSDNTTYTIRAQATANVGKVYYNLMKKTANIDDEVFEKSGEVNLIYVLSQDESIVNNKIYYKQETDNGVTAYVPVVQPFGNPIDNEYYEQYCECKINNAGTYCIQAVARSGISRNSANSNKMTFPEASLPELKTDMISIIMTSTNDEDYTGGLAVSYVDGYINNGIPSYVWSEQEKGVIADATKSSLTVNEEGIYQVQVTNTKNNTSKTSLIPNTFRVTKPAQQITIKGSNVGNVIINSEDLLFSIDLTDVNFDNLTVQWYKKGAESPIASTVVNGPINGIKEFKLSNEGLVAGDQYYAKITNNLNGSIAETRTDYWTIVNI